MYDPKPTQRHQLTLNYLSGNTQHMSPTVVQQIPSHWTLDWRSHFSPSRGVTLGVGMTNITNRIPPGRPGNSKQAAIGIDTRYGDFRGRTLTLSLDAKF
jgi:outer membrane receptor protein involved in Fe transport